MHQPPQTRPSSHHIFARSVLAAAAHLALASTASGLIATASTPAYAQGISRSYDIPAASLEEALSRFGSAAGILLSFNAEITQGRSSSGLRGNFTVEAGLASLLANTGLQAVRQADGSYQIRRSASASATAPAAAATTTAGAETAAVAGSLPPVTVSARAQRPGDLPETYAGGQVARGGGVGLLGNMDFMDTPFSTVTYTEERINDTQAKDIGSVIATADPSVYVSQALGLQESFLMRGFAVNAGDISFNGLQGMAPYMRGSTEMAERVEVFKGPSAMLKGMPPGGGVGGSVNLVPKRAGDAPLARLTTSYASDSQFGLHADVGQRFGDSKQFGVRFNGVYRDGDTAVDNQKHKMALGSLGLDWRGSRVRLSADIYRQRERLDGIDYFGIGTIGSAVTQLPSPLKGDTNLAAPWLFNINRTTAAMVRGEWDVTDQVTAYAAYGRRDASYDALIAQSTLLNNAGDMSTSLVRQYMFAKLYSAEAGVRGHVSTGAVDHSWSLVATSYENKSGFRNIRNSTDPDFLRPLNFYTLDFGSTPNVGSFSTAGVAVSSKNRLQSIGLADRMAFLNDAVQLTLGVRHQTIKNIAVSPAGAETVSYDKSALSPSAALLVKLTPQLSVYGSYIQGLSQGGTAPSTAANANEVLAPFKSKQYELGAKYDFGNFAATAALFQIARPSLYTDPATNIYAANGEQRNRGLELNVFGEATRGLRLLGGLTYLQATLRNQQVARNNGNQATGVPKIVARLGAEYDIAAVRGLTLTGLINHVGKRYATADNRLSLASYTTLNVGARYTTRIAGRSVALRASVDNLTNKAYWGGSWGASGDSGISGGLGAPRTFQLSASVDF